MPIKIALIAFFWCCIIVLSCSKKRESNAFKFNKHLLSQEIKSQLSKRPAEIKYIKELKDFYVQRNFQPIWDQLRNDSTKRSELKNLLYSSENEGLSSKFYHVDSIDQLLEYLQSNFDSFHEKLAFLEILVSDGLIALHHDRVFGRSNPKEIFGTNYMLPLDTMKDFNLLEPLNYGEFSKVFEKNELNNSLEYQSLKKILALERDKWEKTDKKPFSFKIPKNIKILLGDSFQEIDQVVYTLIQKGYLNQKDSSLAKSSTYKRKIFQSIKKFQEAVGLHPDGILGFNTFQALNLSPLQKILQIQANLERCRWFSTHKLKAPFIYINLPEYNLYLHYADSINVQKVCIGKQKPIDYERKLSKFLETKKWYHKPTNFETPQIFSKIRYLVLNPKWGVPKSIVMREMWHLMIEDSCYLTNNHYEVYQNNQVIDGDTINWKRYKADKHPFHIKQKAGDFNALGKIKFIFSNPFSIFLHDTPQKSKFENVQRSVSHGCVRVENPLEIGEFLMQDHKKINRDEFRMKLGYEPLDEQLKKQWRTDTLLQHHIEDSTKIIFLEKTIPIYFDYKTITFDEQGKEKYHFDIYDQNKLIVESFEGKQTSPIDVPKNE